MDPYHQANRRPTAVQPRLLTSPQPTLNNNESSAPLLFTLIWNPTRPGRVTQRLVLSPLTVLQAKTPIHVFCSNVFLERVPQMPLSATTITSPIPYFSVFINSCELQKKRLVVVIKERQTTNCRDFVVPTPEWWEWGHGATSLVAFVNHVYVGLSPCFASYMGNRLVRQPIGHAPRS